MTTTLIAGVDLGESPYQYRVEKHHLGTDRVVFKLIDEHGINQDFGVLSEVIEEIMWMYHYPKPVEYAALYALLDAQ